MCSKSDGTFNKSVATIHNSPSYDQDISLDTWFICNSKLMLFKNFEVYALHTAKNRWRIYRLKITKMLAYQYGYGNFILLTSSFNNINKTLYIFCRHYQEGETALIKINLRTLQCHITKNNIQCDECYGVMINNQFHLIHSEAQLIWNETHHQFIRIRDLTSIHWDSQCIYISQKDILLLFDSNKLYGYSLSNRNTKIAKIKMKMPYIRMKEFGIAESVKGRYVLMFGGLYDYGLKSGEIFIYDTFQNAFGLCSIKSPVKGRCRVIVNNYDDGVIAGYMRIYLGYCIHEIVQLIQSVLYRDIVNVFPANLNQFYWEIDTDILIENTSVWIPCAM